MTGAWCAAVAFYAAYRVYPPPFSALQLLEVLRDTTWCLFLLKLLGSHLQAGPGQRPRRAGPVALAIFALCAGLAGVILANR